MRTGGNGRRSRCKVAPQRGAAGSGLPGAGETQDEGSPVTRTGTSGTGVGRATERGQPGREAATHPTSAVWTGPSQPGSQAGHLDRKTTRGRRTERESERKRRGRGRELKASVDANASTVRSKEASEIAGGEGCWRRNRGHADTHQMRNSSGDRKPQGGGHARGRPQVSGQGRSGALVTRQAQEQGADEARQDEGAAKRTRGRTPTRWSIVRSARTRKRQSSTCPEAHWEESTVR